jgi:hypothetical protein
MKTLTIILGVILLGVIIYFWIKHEQKIIPTDNTREIKLLSKITTLEQQDSLSRVKIDSLESLKNKVKTQIVYREREIDEAVSKDSTASLVWYRKSLVENQELPDKTDELTYREITLGALYLAKVPKLQLTINLQDEQLERYKQLDKDCEHIKEGYKDIIQIKDLSIQDLKDELEKNSSFSDDRIIIYSGIGISYGADNKLQPTLQLGIGLRLITLWKNNSIVIK